MIFAVAGLVLPVLNAGPPAGWRGVSRFGMISAPQAGTTEQFMARSRPDA
jgi:hypothetical protein